MNEIKEKLKRVPDTFGVYLMKDAKGRVLYVGKAKNLKARLSSYFLRNIEDAKTRVLVHQIADFEVILLSNEVEALLLERNLIREHKPDYNVILRDDKEYPYLRIDMQNEWPRIKKVRRRKDDGAIYLGPYSHVGHLNSILDLTYRIFPLIRCSEYTFKTVTRPCNYYHMKRCLGPCTLPVDNKLYKDMMQSAVDFLQGKDKSVLRKLKEQMAESAEEERYETAARYRDQILALKVVTQNQNVVIKNIQDCDAIGYSQDQEQISFHVLKIREGKITGRENFILPMRLSDVQKALSDFILQYYEKQFIPSEIYTPIELNDANIEEVLRRSKEGKAVHLSCPQRGQKKSLVELSATNSRYHLEEALTKKSKEKIRLEHLKDKLLLKNFPFRIDCFDISNIQGTAIVASQVCFIGAKPAKDRYRLYNIEDLRQSPDDYWAIRTVLQRYFKSLQESNEVPDLLLIDGGKGQLSSALSVAKEFPEFDFDILSIAKNHVMYGMDDSKTQTEERIFFPGQSEPYVLNEGTMEFQLLTQIRDEAHRFAITQHRRRRKKISTMSFLDAIKGIGPQTKKRILRQITDMDALRTMSVEEFMQLTKASKSIAEKVLLALKIP